MDPQYNVMEAQVQRQGLVDPQYSVMEAAVRLHVRGKDYDDDKDDDVEEEEDIDAIVEECKMRMSKLESR